GGVEGGGGVGGGRGGEVKGEGGGERLELVFGEHADLRVARSLLDPLSVGDTRVDEHARRLTVPVTGGAEVLMDGLRVLDADGVRVLDVALRRPTLDDVFLTLTGHAAEPPTNGNGDGHRDTGGEVIDGVRARQEGKVR